jgi:predicted transcriptional regulator
VCAYLGEIFLHIKTIPPINFAKAERRSEIGIMRDILSATRKVTGKNRIMSKSNLSCVQLENYLNLLLELELLEYNSDQKSEKQYSITSKGQKFVSDYSKIKLLID